MFDLFYEFEYINVINITNICFMYTLNELYDGKKIGLNKIVKSYKNYYERLMDNIVIRTIKNHSYGYKYPTKSYDLIYKNTNTSINRLLPVNFKIYKIFLDNITINTTTSIPPQIYNSKKVNLKLKQMHHNASRRMHRVSRPVPRTSRPQVLQTFRPQVRQRTRTSRPQVRQRTRTSKPQVRQRTRTSRPQVRQRTRTSRPQVRKGTRYTRNVTPLMNMPKNFKMAIA